ncbi:TIGR02757 family protein [Marinoscillum sp. MHG1-6]|uniref:TIGR02757 family protein n=1 Tax=Marinoscillum sp. MHG1-6 TaxID=2959627 RepID=UPI0021572D05|nr:TIGR02757 family protein [Marinoscillum sp. MHG1-6]
MRSEELKDFLDEKFLQYHVPGFIENDPICIPHSFHHKQDIEIAAFMAAVLAWGQRKTIINKCREFFELMDNAPYEFIMNHKETELKPFLAFKHRTYNATDALYFIHYFRWHYLQYESLEDAFLQGGYQPWDAERGLSHHFSYFFSLPDHPTRTYKHIPDPRKKSACKRINMFLRWMVREDVGGVDFGLWKRIKPSELICPCDVHVDRVARKLGLITRKQTDWQTAIELTEELKKLDPKDPVKYDFALFGLGIEEKF